VCILSEINSGTSIKQVRKYERATLEALNLSKSMLKIIKMISYDRMGKGARATGQVLRFALRTKQDLTTFH